MDSFRVTGGRPLSGTVKTSGSKNACLPMLAATLLLDGPATLHNVPHLRDVDTILLLLKELGVSATQDGEEIHYVVTDQSAVDAPYDIVRRMRASICVLGPLLARRGAAVVSLPGGCVFGDRPIDLHLKGLRALGAEIKMMHGSLVAKVGEHGLRGATIDLSSPFGSTVLGTMNVLMASCLAKGQTKIINAALEPEVVELINFLNQCGAKISGQGSSTLIIDGVTDLHACDYSVPPDRIEAATLLIAAAITKGEVLIANCQPLHLDAVCVALQKAGYPLTATDNSIHLDARKTDGVAHSVVTAPYPGFPTDVQAQWMALCTQLSGDSQVSEQIYPERFMHVSELQRLGADLQRCANQVMVRGPVRLSGAEVMASDLRASAALVLAALVSSGETIIRRVYHLDRGYQNLEEKLTTLGANVRRVVDESSP
ncbi:MAG: UDP-N-acetylglucosamine 1-carboxyvinyltransferase [Planctomycetes bacterium]|nr:UDP-N-acetylglucosamine 1-carboxyvinyltransferase [Planctomycetota bacterium]